tara:strand:+ start:2895 stop:3083 length:189 start_codon:yes stop_codon:yes gene_type:complete
MLGLSVTECWDMGVAVGNFRVHLARLIDENHARVIEIPAACRQLYPGEVLRREDKFVNAGPE